MVRSLLCDRKVTGLSCESSLSTKVEEMLRMINDPPPILANRRAFCIEGHLFLEVLFIISIMFLSGFSISIMKADQTLLQRLDATTKAPHWPVGSAGIDTCLCLLFSLFYKMLREETWSGINITYCSHIDDLSCIVKNIILTFQYNGFYS